VSFWGEIIGNALFWNHAKFQKPCGLYLKNSHAVLKIGTMNAITKNADESGLQLTRAATSPWSVASVSAIGPKLSGTTVANGSDLGALLNNSIVIKL
jgi:hypothetical protein